MAQLLRELLPTRTEPWILLQHCTNSVWRYFSIFLALGKQRQEDQKFNYPLLLSDFEVRLDYTEGGDEEEGEGGREGGQASKQERDITASVEEAEKLEPPSIAGGNADRCSSVGNIGRFLKEVRSYLRSCPFY